jgi:hypothetical protein
MLDEYLHYRRFHRMEPSVGGYLVSNLTEADLGAEATAGTEAGRVLHATSLEELEVITAPANGVWRQVARSYPTRPGGWGFAVADLDDPDTGWRSPW